MIEKIIFSFLSPTYKKVKNNNIELTDLNKNFMMNEQSEKFIISTRNQFKHALMENNEIENIDANESEINYIRYKIKENKWNNRGTFTGFGKKLLVMKH